MKPPAKPKCEATIHGRSGFRSCGEPAVYAGTIKNGEGILDMLVCVTCAEGIDARCAWIEGSVRRLP
jgi:hypothetical protein